jgi:hypothetical protein
MAMHFRRDYAAQRAQTAPCVPVQVHTCPSSTMCDRARHRAPSMLAAPPCPLAGRSTLALPHSNRTLTEPLPVPNMPESHRHRRLYT